MKHQLVRLILACSTACVAVSNMHAQSFATVGEVPFAFTVGKSTLAAGKYTFSQRSLDMHQTIQNGKTGRTILLNANPSLSGAARARLIFNRYGNRYFLSQIWTPEGKGLVVGMSAAEKEAREAAAPTEEATLSIPLLAQR